MTARDTTEELPSGKNIRITYDESGEKTKETHCYGMLDIACTMHYRAGTQVGEDYFFKRRLVGRKKYEKERLNFPDMRQPTKLWTIVELSC